MYMTAELSMYPLREDYLPPIKAVIKKLHDFPQLQVQTFATGTTLGGDMDAVMQALSETLKWSHAEYGIAVFVAKLIPGYRPD